MLPVFFEEPSRPDALQARHTIVVLSRKWQKIVLLCDTHVRLCTRLALHTCAYLTGSATQQHVDHPKVPCTAFVSRKWLVDAFRSFTSRYLTTMPGLLDWGVTYTPSF